MSMLAAKALEAGWRVLYASPTQDQIERFWYAVRGYFTDDIQAGTLVKNETKHLLERPDAKENDPRIRAKTAWNSDTLRGDWGTLIILDEYQMMKDDLDEVILPMLLDTDGVVVYAGTPAKSKTNQLRVKFQEAELDDTAQNWHIPSHDNPFLSKDALERIASRMRPPQYKREILAQFTDEVEGALWKEATINETRVMKHPELTRIVVAIDPATWSGETGICVAGSAKVNGELHAYILADETTTAEPYDWANTAISAYNRFGATLLVYEKNQGGKMIPHTIKVYDKNIPMRDVQASVGKVSRAEPVEGMYRQGRVHHVGFLKKLEDQMTSYVAGEKSPDRLDAMVWAVTDLILPRQSSNKKQKTIHRVPQRNFTRIGGR